MCNEISSPRFHASECALPRPRVAFLALTPDGSAVVVVLHRGDRRRLLQSTSTSQHQTLRDQTFKLDKGLEQLVANFLVLTCQY